MSFPHNIPTSSGSSSTRPSFSPATIKRPSPQAISKIMKRILPPDYVISQEALDMIQVCYNDFICFVAGEAISAASIRASAGQVPAKTIQGADVVQALDNLGIDPYSELIKNYVSKFKQQYDSDILAHTKLTAVAQAYSTGKSVIPSNMATDPRSKSSSNSKTMKSKPLDLAAYQNSKQYQSAAPISYTKNIPISTYGSMIQNMPTSYAHQSYPAIGNMTTPFAQQQQRQPPLIAPPAAMLQKPLPPQQQAPLQQLPMTPNREYGNIHSYQVLHSSNPDVVQSNTQNEVLPSKDIDSQPMEE